MLDQLLPRQSPPGLARKLLELLPSLAPPLPPLRAITMLTAHLVARPIRPIPADREGKERAVYQGGKIPTYYTHKAREAVGTDTATLRFMFHLFLTPHVGEKKRAGTNAGVGFPSSLFVIPSTPTGSPIRDTNVCVQRGRPWPPLLTIATYCIFSYLAYNYHVYVTPSVRGCERGGIDIYLDLYIDI